MSHQKELNELSGGVWELEGFHEDAFDCTSVLNTEKIKAFMSKSHNHINAPKLFRANSTAANLQPFSGLQGLSECVKQVPNRSLMRHPSLCSLARVFDEIEKSNQDAEPFFVNDLVMIDAKLRDWKRLMPNIKPSYDIKCSPDTQILKRLVQGGAVFSCEDEYDLELVDELEEDNIAKLHKVPSKSTENVMVYASSEEELKSIHEQNPDIQIILRLVDTPCLGSPRDELEKLLNCASNCKINVIGVSMPMWQNFESDIKESMTLLKDLKTEAEKLGINLSVFASENEIPEEDFERSSSLLSFLVECYFPQEGTQFHIQASNHFSQSSHFLFTRVLSVTRKTDANDQPLHEIITNWPEEAQRQYTSRPHYCLTKKFAGVKTRIFSQSETLICEEDLSPLMVGEWLFWNNVATPHPKRGEKTNLPKNYHSFRFEGPEKKFELNYKPIPGNNIGFRALGSEEWQEILNHGHLLILSEKKNEDFDSYLLSESSLFVYPYKVIIKTCGISSPLLCTNVLKETAKKMEMELDSIVFSRRSFICPLGQCYPHRSLEEEMNFLTQNFPGGEVLNLGDPVSDHWFLYSAKIADDGKMDPTPSFEVTMTGLMNQESLKNFWRDENASEQSVATKSGFAELTPQADIDEYSFNPCGFSYNGLDKNGFVTVHITPELPLCYISFETNISGLSYEDTLDKLIARYQPAHFTVLILNNGGGTRKIPGYKVTHQNLTTMNGVPVIFERRKKEKRIH